ncbi:hypothetical protein [Nocardia pseudobrasiliensis]|uniref:ANTAR domain-containing protein n=1 Tax=Nocardia pseudobrasiliensis TaxID=45979 RepID=A0A370IDB2_9NOCA|nr:hypothetical protein [Nocardia pseudobrasiliensis]RDI67384.1 hypothetical protein DFR76_103455 [Nocardia pseudobrasiliensis]
MSSDSESSVGRAWARFSDELRRAARAAGVAARFENEARLPPESLRSLRLRLGHLHRQIENRHRACARLYRHHAMQLQRWSERPEENVLPVLMAAVASELSMDSAGLTLFDRQDSEVMVAASDRLSWTAQNVELTLGDGPARSAVADRRPVTAVGAEMIDRWPIFGPAAAELGIAVVVAVPFLGAGAQSGALCAFAARPQLDLDMPRAAECLADALIETILNGLDDGDVAELGIRAPASDDDDGLLVLHRAMGMVAADHGCSPAVALSLMRARSFVTGEHLTTLAYRVLGGDCDLR